MKYEIKDLENEVRRLKLGPLRKNIGKLNRASSRVYNSIAELANPVQKTIDSYCTALAETLEESDALSVYASNIAINLALCQLKMNGQRKGVEDIDQKTEKYSKFAKAYGVELAMQISEKFEAVYDLILNASYIRNIVLDTHFKILPYIRIIQSIHPVYFANPFDKDEEQEATINEVFKGLEELTIKFEKNIKDAKCILDTQTEIKEYFEAIQTDYRDLSDVMSLLHTLCSNGYSESLHPKLICMEMKYTERVDEMMKRISQNRDDLGR